MRCEYMEKNTKKVQRVLWFNELGAEQTPTDHWFNRTEKIDHDLIATLEQLIEMARNREITGVSIVANTPNEALQLIMAGNSYDSPCSAIAGIGRLQEFAEHLISTKKIKYQKKGESA